MNSIVLTGATSMIGVALIEQCIKENIKVLAIVHPKSCRINRVPNSELITVFECKHEDFIDFSVFSDIVQPMDVFYHIGWSDADKQGRDLCAKQADNIKFTLSAVSLAKKLGCKRFIGIGSQAEYGNFSHPLSGSIAANPETAYGVAKYAAGKLSAIECEKLHLEYIWVRILSVYGINDNDETLIKLFISNCKNNRPMPLSACTHIWDYLYEDDAGRALIAIGRKGKSGKIYCLGSGIGRPLKEYLEIIKNAINAEYCPEYGKIPYMEKSLKYLCADISELTADTGWKPEMSFEDGIKRMLGH
jgi:nucleoside-diphosphate-sugar epimerase